MCSMRRQEEEEESCAVRSNTEFSGSNFMYMAEKTSYRRSRFLGFGLKSGEEAFHTLLLFVPSM